MTFFEYQHVPSGKKNVSLIMRVELCGEGQEIFLFRGEVFLPVNDHGGHSNPGRVHSPQKNEPV